MIEDRFRLRQRGRWRIAQRQHDIVRSDAASIAEFDLQRHVPLDPTHANDCGANDLEANVRWRTELRCEQHFLQVFAVQRPRQKIFRRDIGDTPLHELHELIGYRRTRRHAGGRHIQQIGMRALGVCHTATDCWHRVR